MLATAYEITDLWTCDQDGTTQATTTRTDPRVAPVIPDGWANLNVAQGSQGVVVTLCPTCFAPFAPAFEAWQQAHPSGP
jgi:hypothetical protein